MWLPKIHAQWYDMLSRLQKEGSRCDRRDKKSGSHPSLSCQVNHVLASHLETVRNLEAVVFQQQQLVLNTRHQRVEHIEGQGHIREQGSLQQGESISYETAPPFCTSQCRH